MRIENCKRLGKNPDYEEEIIKDLRRINYHIKEMSSETGLSPGSWISKLNYKDFNDYYANEAKLFIDSLSTSIRARNRIVSDQRNSLVELIKNKNISLPGDIVFTEDANGKHDHTAWRKQFPAFLVWAFGG